MRKFFVAMFLAFTIVPSLPDVAMCQRYEFSDPDDDDVEPQQRQQRRPPVNRPRRTWRNNPIVLGAAAVTLLVVLPFGIFKVVRQMRYMTQASQREKAPWEGEPGQR